MTTGSKGAVRHRRTLFRWFALGVIWMIVNLVLYQLFDRWKDFESAAGRSITRAALQAYTGRQITVPSHGADGPASRVLRYRLMEPREDSPDETFPVLLFLHGAGERGDNNRQQLQGLPARMASRDWRERFPCFLIAPQCPRGESWTERLSDLQTLLGQVLQDPRADRDRVYVTGLSMGGFGTWALAARYPDLFAAAAPICGGGDPTTAKRLVDLPIWAVHGAADDVVPVERSREMVDAVQVAGGDIRYTELPGVSHDSWTAAYADLDGIVAWLFRQERSDD